ncbi:hypothetical protein [Pseudonocardia sp. GCM10023141]|uniref:hypothetical protein n=1 Tax=Pseudonocardia sp. GCM10023141 TaxID=3252653 RepID=UPI003615A411
MFLDPEAIHTASSSSMALSGGSPGAARIVVAAALPVLLAVVGILALGQCLSAETVTGAEGSLSIVRHTADDAHHHGGGFSEDAAVTAAVSAGELMTAGLHGCILVLCTLLAAFPMRPQPMSSPRKRLLRGCRAVVARFTGSRPPSVPGFYRLCVLRQ